MLGSHVPFGMDRKEGADGKLKSKCSRECCLMVLFKNLSLMDRGKESVLLSREQLKRLKSELEVEDIIHTKALQGGKSKEKWCYQVEIEGNEVLL